MREKLRRLMLWTRVVRWLHVCVIFLFMVFGITFGVGFFRWDSYILDLFYLSFLVMIMALFGALEVVANVTISIMSVEEDEALQEVDQT